MTCVFTLCVNKLSQHTLYSEIIIHSVHNAECFLKLRPCRFHWAIIFNIHYVFQLDAMRW